MNWSCLALPGILGMVSALHPALGVALFLASIPAIVYFLQSPVLGLSVVTLAALFVAVGAAAGLARQRALRLTWASAAWLAFLGACLAGTAVRFSEILAHYPSLLWRNLLASDQLNPFVFVGESTMWTIAVILYLVVRRMAEDHRQLRVVAYGLLAQGVGFLAVTFWDIVHFSKPFPEHMLQSYLRNQPGSYGMFSDHNSFAVFCMIQCTLLLGAFVVLRGVVLRIVAIAFLATHVLLLVLSLSLSTLAAACLVLPLGVLLVYLRSWRGRLGFTLLALTLVGGGLLGYSRLAPEGDLQAAVNQRMDLLTPSRLWESTSDLRRYPWGVSLEMIRESPILGIGAGRFYQSFPEYRPAMDPGPLWTTVFPHENAHNYYLQIGAEMGLIGLFMLLAFVGWTLVRANWREPIRATAGLAFVAVAITSLLQHPLLEESIFFGFLAIAAIVPGARRVSPKGSPPRLLARRPLPEIAAGCLAVLFVAHAASAWGEMPSRLEWGIYGIERGAKDFRWTYGLAVIKSASLDDRLVVELQAHNPDIQENPLVVTIEQGGKRVGRVELRDHDWHGLTADVRPEQPIVLRTSRTFRPPAEVRELGVAVSGLP